jgi:hypothetical protein
VSQTIVAVIGSDVAGPLGVAHLPRRWLRAILRHTGRLAGRNDAREPARDAALADGLRLDAAAFDAFLRTLPTYVACEAWVRANAERLDDATIAQLNAKVDDADNVPLWNELHAWLLAHRDQPLEPIVPQISSRSVGPLGIKHLPRLWVKALIDAVDALPDGFRTHRMRILRHSGTLEREVAVGGLGGLDVPFLEHFGIDVDRCASFLQTLPTYPAFEVWVLVNATRLEPERIAEYNARRIDARPEKAALDRAAVGLDDPDLLWSYVLNDLQDWQALHDICLAAVR